MGYIEFFPYALAFVIAAPFLIFLRKFIILKEQELKLLSTNKAMSHRIQAYERMMLFLERIKPSYLVTKFNKDIHPHEFVFLIEKTITEEFDYNASMQLYISKNLWQKIISGKNEIIRTAHKTLESIGNNTNLEEYKTLFLMNYINSDDFVSLLQDSLKKEAFALQ